MRYGIVTANLGDYADPRLAVRLARAAEEAGWEAFFVWDHLGFVWGQPSCDPWVVLAAVAASTTRLKLGTALTPLTRRRPHYAVEDVSLAPLPLQRPRVPIWIGGEGAPALRRAARWDGWLAP